MRRLELLFWVATWIARSRGDCQEGSCDMLSGKQLLQRKVQSHDAQEAMLSEVMAKLNVMDQELHDIKTHPPMQPVETQGPLGRSIYDEDPLPRWTSMDFPNMATDGQHCSSRPPSSSKDAPLPNPLEHNITASLVESSRDAHIHFVGGSASCTDEQVLLRRFASGTVSEQCCPGSSLACAGCLRYDSKADRCLECAAGFTKMGSWFKGAQCQLCSDLDFGDSEWSDPEGRSCDAYVEKGWCESGAPTDKGRKALGMAIDLFVSRGLSAVAACCACGGGLRQPMPFTYPVNQKPLLFGRSVELSAMPLPRTAIEYTAEGCNLHKQGLSLNGATGEVIGKITQEEPGIITCAIKAQDTAEGLTATATLTLSSAYFAYPENPLIVTAGRTWEPQTNGRYETFSLQCTPTLPWLKIHSRTGKLTASTGPLVPSLGGCTVTAMTTYCPPDLPVNSTQSGKASALLTSDQSKDCVKLSRSTNVDAAVKHEATGIHVVHASDLSKKITKLELTVEETVPLYKIAASSKDDLQVFDAPVAFHFDCTEHSSFNQLTGTLLYKGQEVFTVAPDGQLTGKPAAGLMASCTGSLARCKLSIPCLAYGILPFTGKLVKTSFQMNVWDNTCWSKRQGGFQLHKTISATSMAACRAHCRASGTCSAFAFSAGQCKEARASPLGTSSDDVYIKVRDCSVFTRCLEISIAGAAYLSGQYCPDTVRDQGSPFFTKPGQIEAATIHLQAVSAKGDLEQQKCAGYSWMLRRSSTEDLILANGPQKNLPVVELRGSALLCIKEELLGRTFQGDGKFSFKALEALVYVEQTTGSCTYPVTSLSACSAAAQSLGLSVTTASDDQQRSVSHDPPYCYLEGGLLKFNSGGNTGACSSSDRCICQQASRYEAVGGCTGCHASHEGADLQALTYSALSDCEAACDSNAQCRHFTACPGDGNRCYLKTGTSRVADVTGVGRGCQMYFPHGTLQKTATAGEASIAVYSCPSPLFERQEYLKKNKMDSEFEDDAAAKQVFRFDDPSTGLMDDFSLGPCECAAEDYGQEFPKAGEAAVPPGSGNQFVAAPMLLVSGSVTCASGGLVKAMMEVGEQADCELEAVKGQIPYFFVGDVMGVMVCRLYATCGELMLEHGSEGQLFGVSFAPSCAMANPEACWMNEKRLEFLTGVTTQVAPGDEVTSKVDSTRGQRKVTSCSASSQYSSSFACGKALDGNMDSHWATKGEGVGSWISLKFGRTVMINTMKYANTWAAERNRDLQLQFADGSTASVQLKDDASLHSYPFPEKRTDSVRINVVSAYLQRNNGAREIEFWYDVRSLSVPCLFEPTLRACDRLKFGELGTIEECGKCLHAADASYLSLRRPLAKSSPVASQLSVSCHPDRWRGMARGGSQLLPSSDLTCVDGRWVDAGGEESLMRFTCEAGARITTSKSGSLIASRHASQEEQWWDSHHGKVIKSWNGHCLAPGNGVKSVHAVFPDNFGTPQLTLTGAAYTLRADGTAYGRRRTGKWYKCGSNCITFDFDKKFYRLLDTRRRRRQVQSHTFAEGSNNFLANLASAPAWWRELLSSDGAPLSLLENETELVSLKELQRLYAEANKATRPGDAFDEDHGRTALLPNAPEAGEHDHEESGEKEVEKEAEDDEQDELFELPPGENETNPESPGKHAQVAERYITDAVKELGEVDEASNSSALSSMLQETKVVAASRRRKRIISTTSHYTGWNGGGGSGIEYLDRHSISCGSGKALKRWKVESKSRRREFRVYFECSQLSAGLGSCHDQYTGLTARGNIHYLDRHDNNCGNRAMAAWKMQPPSRRRDVRIWRKACDVNYGFDDCTTHYTGWNSGGGCAYLDRHDISCAEERVLTSWKTESSGGRRRKVRFYFKCCLAPSPCSEYQCPSGWQRKASGKGTSTDACCDKTCQLYSCPANYAKKNNPHNIIAYSTNQCCDSLCSRYSCPKGYVNKGSGTLQTTGNHIRGSSTATCCELCPAGFHGGGGDGVASGELCSPCPADTYKESGLRDCKSCPAGHFADPGSFTCTKCPCSEGFSCSCSLKNGLSWEVTVPTGTAGKQYEALLTFQGSNIAGCFLNDKPVADGSKQGSSYKLTLRVGAKGKIRLHSTDSDTCTGLSQVSIASPVKAAWNTCRQDSKDAWLLVPLHRFPGRVQMFFQEAQLCAQVTSGLMISCSEDDPTQQIPLLELQSAVDTWTLTERGNINHNCGGVGTSCISSVGASRNVLTQLAKVGSIGDSRDPASKPPLTFLTGFQMQRVGTSGYGYSYRATELHYLKQDCYQDSTTCHPAGSQEHLYQFEAHQVKCKQGAALQSFRFKTCSASNGKNGFQYTYRCCSIQGIGGCDLHLTPWVENAKTSNGPMEALKAAKVQCEPNFVISSFVIEAKDPGESQSELRYDVECCAVPAFMPLSVLTENNPLPDSFGISDGVYFPTRKVEGMVEMRAGFQYSTGKIKSAQEAGIVRYDKFSGEWCIDWPKAGMSCVQSTTGDHVLQLGQTQDFDVSSLELQAREDSGPALDEIKVVNFKKPPRIERIALKKRKLEAFKPSKKLVKFDLGSVANWVPQTPQYKPYCALRDPKQWKAIDEAAEEESSGWGTDGRNDLETLNTEENLDRTKDVRNNEWHPCRHYFADISEIDRPAFTNDFGIGDFTNLDKVGKKLGVSGGGGKDWNTGLGHTALAEERCEERRVKREWQEEEDDFYSEHRKRTYDTVLAVGSPVCSALPETGAVMAPLGGGISISVPTPEICKSVLESAHSAAHALEDKWLFERIEWNRLNSMREDQCTNSDVPGHMYKIYCDMHCLEDAVLKGNSAILRSMKSLETHIITTLHDIVQHYTSETFEKIKETQSQITHNDKQMADILTDYVGQIMNQNSEYTEALNKAIGMTFPPLNKLQKDIATVNGNLNKVNEWLKSNGVLNPPKLLQRQLVLPEVNSSLSQMHHAIVLASDAAVGLVQDLHAKPAGVVGVDEESIAAQLVKTHRQLKGRVGKIKEALQQGSWAVAQGHAFHVAGELQRAKAVLATKVREEPAQTFQRRSARSLSPAWAQLGQQLVSLSSIHVSLNSFHAEQRVVMGRASSLGELSDEAERYAAAEMMVKFDAEIAKARRSFSTYLEHAQEHLTRRSRALLLLREGSKATSCRSNDFAKHLGLELAQTDRAERRSRAALHQAWQDSADSCARLADLLVDGGLLLHHIRLTAAGVTTQDLKKGNRGTTGLEAQLALLEKPLHAALLEDAGNFVKQVNRAFTMSQLLADSWSTSGIAMPQDELRDIRAAWTKLRQASRDLQKELRPGSQLHLQLLLRALESASGPGRSSQSLYPVPEMCRNKLQEDRQTEGEVMLWRQEPANGAFLLLTSAGALLRCKADSGKLSPANFMEMLEEAGHQFKSDLGDFLSFLST